MMTLEEEIREMHLDVIRKMPVDENIKFMGETVGSLDRDCLLRVVTFAMREIDSERSFWHQSIDNLVGLTKQR